jgi:hypothetical protein
MRKKVVVRGNLREMLAACVRRVGDNPLKPFWKVFTIHTVVLPGYCESAQLFRLVVHYGHRSSEKLVTSLFQV